ncbi:MAG: alpha-ketoglutarate-dependent dioxygenase AlkB [Moritella sp.]|uniref:alpha-ketoglutarate-dependent dioxygenase AlkB n=1 Tax=Moritella sp. TaxID=78556 RepID=UPI001DB4EB2D|nr:alpha-ketoglutarate-dependent dioxygenase AlkB [Moritella sp.]NQZ52268.1 alpha-ketoglutarate-dependent dioxygenase AlkB [Moritella sp.]
MRIFAMLTAVVLLVLVHAPRYLFNTSVFKETTLTTADIYQTMGSRASPRLKIDTKNTSPTVSPRISSPRISSPSSPMAAKFFKPPYASPHSSDNDSANLSDNSKHTKTVKKKKSVCPCQKSSAGQAWLLPCTECKQVWHNTCANLKGNLSQPTVDSILKTWQCPWCWTCPYPRPQNHQSSKNEQTLLSETFTSAIAQNVSELIMEATKNTLHPQVDLEPINSQLIKLTAEIENLKSVTPPSSISTEDLSPPSIHQTPTDNIKLTCPEPAVEDYKEDYLPANELSDISHFLNQCVKSEMFFKENGHSVLKYGEEYSYRGDKGPKKPDPIPQLLNNLIDKLSTDFKLEHKPNSVLINHYLGTEGDNASASVESFLPPHSDDEPEIIAESKIITLTIGATRPLVFTSTHDPSKPNEILSPSNNSIYVMTSSSQGWYRHGIRKTQETVRERFSISLRCVSSKFKRSTIVVGDSNTQEFEFGPGRGKFGESYPGKRVKAGYIDHIKPADCIGYSNIIIACGTNNLRIENIKHISDIDKVFFHLKYKIDQIKVLCKKAKIFIMPVLPTRIPEMNRNIGHYNRLVRGLTDQSNGVLHMPSLRQFCDSQNLLNYKFTRSGDAIHLGSMGVAKFVRHIKECIFTRESFTKLRGVSMSANHSQKVVRAAELGSQKPP